MPAKIGSYEDEFTIVSFKKIATLVTLVVVAVVGIVSCNGLTGYNDLQTYQIWQGVTGSVDVIDSPGYYNRNFGTVWKYPKSVQVHFSASKNGSAPDESIRSTFNDAGSAQISTMLQFNMPLEKAKRLQLHQLFGGNMDNIEHAIHAHLVNCIKNTGPLMSATENQTSRKGEFTQAVEDQLRHGLYSMKRIRVKLLDRVDDKGDPIYVDATDIIKNDTGVPIRVDKSPLEQYGIELQQFSITETEYDEKSKAQFGAKQDALLAAEKSKAQREQEIQQKLMVVAQGERQVAEIEAAANQVKAKAVTEGKQKVEVAEQTKLEAETAANQQLAVAKIAKEQAETEAKKAAEVARIDAERNASILKIRTDAELKAAENLANAKKLEASGIIAIAEAEQKKIQLGGAVKESDRVLADIARDRDIQVAKALSNIHVPSTIIQGGGSGGQGQGDNFTQYLLNLTMLKNLGVLPNAPAGTVSQPAQPVVGK